MSTLFARSFWQDTFERTVSSAAQGFIVGGGLGAGADVAGAVDARYFPWVAAASTAVGMAVLTFTKCLAAIRQGNEGTASFSRAVKPDA